MRVSSRVAVALALTWSAGQSGRTAAQAIPAVDDAKLPRFEVASVKLGNPNSDVRTLGVPPGRLVQQDAELYPSTVLLAFGILPHQIAGPLPDILTRERYTIDARVPADAKRPDLSLMVRALLIDRFKLRYHIEHVEADGFALVPVRRNGRLGPQIKPSVVDCLSRLAARGRNETLPPLPAGAAECVPRVGGPGAILLRGMPFATLVPMLAAAVGRPVVDQTQLRGTYDIELRYTPASTSPPRPDSAPIPDDTASIFIAIQEQLGLKLTPARVPTDKVAIDHVERPEPD